jgi:hypothetical protein
MELREAFKRMRVLRALSWDAVAREIGVKRGSLSAWASGAAYSGGVEPAVQTWLDAQPAELRHQAARVDLEVARRNFRVLGPEKGEATRRASDPTPGQPGKRAVLLPVPATAEDAKDWLYQEWRRRGLAHAAIQERLMQLTDQGAMREANLLRVSLGLPPYLPPHHPAHGAFA